MPRKSWEKLRRTEKNQEKLRKKHRGDTIWLLNSLDSKLTTRST